MPDVIDDGEEQEPFAPEPADDPAPPAAKENATAKPKPEAKPAQEINRPADTSVGNMPPPYELAAAVGYDAVYLLEAFAACMAHNENQKVPHLHNIFMSYQMNKTQIDEHLARIAARNERRTAAGKPAA